jgi:hypothetical protein
MKPTGPIKVGIILIVVASLAACSAQTPTAQPTGTLHAIPHDRHAPSTVPTDGTVNGAIPASAAPLDELWALVDSSLRGGKEMNGRMAGQIEPTMIDFQNAISVRCEPTLTPAQVADLHVLWATVENQAADPAARLHDVEKAYFDTATRDCM